MRTLVHRAVPVIVGLAAFALTLWGIAWLRGAADARPPGPHASSAPVAPRIEPKATSDTEAHEGAALDPAALQTAMAEAADAAEEQVRTALIDDVSRGDEPLEFRVDVYRAALEAAVAGSGHPEVLEYRGVWTEHFLRMPVVQDELASLPPSARASALASIRRRMGYSDEAVERLAITDERREVAWANGLTYVDERERLRNRLRGEALDEALSDLRVRSFGDNATTIAREEAAGFERFERPRVYGRN